MSTPPTKPIVFSPRQCICGGNITGFFKTRYEVTESVCNNAGFSWGPPPPGHQVGAFNPDVVAECGAVWSAPTCSEYFAVHIMNGLEVVPVKPSIPYRRHIC